MNKRPLSVTVIAWIYIAVGTVGFVYHLTEFGGAPILTSDALWIELIRLVAVVCGAYMLRGQNWARWAAIAWIGLHVVVSAFHGGFELGVHCLFFAVIAWFLFRTEAAEYFGSSRSGPRSHTHFIGR
jgi:hypothetical protein